MKKIITAAVLFLATALVAFSQTGKGLGKKKVFGKNPTPLFFT